MKKMWFLAAAVFTAAAVFYLSRTGHTLPNELVQGALIGRPRLTQGATLCVNKIQNLSEKPLQLESLEQTLAARLNRAGFRARLTPEGAPAGCEATVFGEVVSLKGKDRMEAQVEFRVLMAGEQAPSMSSIAKGKSSDLPRAGIANSPLPGHAAFAAKGAAKKDPSTLQQEAIDAAFADVARQVELQRPSKSTRGAIQ